MKVLGTTLVWTSLCWCASTVVVHGEGHRPVILDTDYGPFIDDIFALGLLMNSDDLLDLQYVLTTSEQPDLSARCVAKHVDLAGKQIRVGSGEAFPDYTLRGGVCAIPGLVGFTLEAECQEVTIPYDHDGVGALAELLEASDRSDWIYIVVGGQTSLKSLMRDYSVAAGKISTIIVMGGNWCADFEPFPGDLAPTDELNISCDPAAANFVLDKSNHCSANYEVIYVPLAVADKIGGDDYSLVVASANAGNAGAAAILQFYKAWSAAGRADENLLIHQDALAYDPDTESTPQFDACAIMAAIEMLDDKEDRLFWIDIPQGVHFLEATDSGLNSWPDSPRSAFSLLPTDTCVSDLPDQCPALTDFTFVPEETPEEEVPVKVALGFVSAEAKASFYREMAERMAGSAADDTSAKCRRSLRITD